jgi:hypothetical protein
LVFRYKFLSFILYSFYIFNYILYYYKNVLHLDKTFLFDF